MSSDCNAILSEETSAATLIFFFFLILHNCISFAKYQNESTTGIHVFPSSLVLYMKCIFFPPTVPTAYNFSYKLWVI